MASAKCFTQFTALRAKTTTTLGNAGRSSSLAVSLPSLPSPGPALTDMLAPDPLSV